MRDRLIELLKEAERNFSDTGRPILDIEEYVADHLLAEGVIVPPVPVGGTVYTLNKGRAKAWKVYFIGMNALGGIKFLIADDGFKHMLEVWNCDIGKTVFLTREEAEAALAEREVKG